MSFHASQICGSRSTASCLITLPVFSLIAANELCGGDRAHEALEPRISGTCASVGNYQFIASSVVLTIRCRGLE